MTWNLYLALGGLVVQIALIAVQWKVRRDAWDRIGKARALVDEAIAHHQAGEREHQAALAIARGMRDWMREIGLPVPPEPPDRSVQ
jgi:hypothetical protein